MNKSKPTSMRGAFLNQIFTGTQQYLFFNRASLLKNLILKAELFSLPLQADFPEGLIIYYIYGQKKSYGRGFIS